MSFGEQSKCSKGFLSYLKVEKHCYRLSVPWEGREIVPGIRWRCDQHPQIAASVSTNWSNSHKKQPTAIFTYLFVTIVLKLFHSICT